MLYRQSNGNLIEINRKKYINDIEYYKEIYKYISSIIENPKIDRENTMINNNEELMGNSNDDIINYRESKN
jgi:hypothetical protein